MNQKYIEELALTANTNTADFFVGPFSPRFQAEMALAAAVVTSVFDKVHTLSLNQQIEGLASMLNVNNMDFCNARAQAFNHLVKITGSPLAIESLEGQEVVATFQRLMKEAKPVHVPTLLPLREHTAIATAFVRASAFAPSKDQGDTAKTIA